ncbi:energy-coupling factor transporter ATP-binding protein [Ligilactobacillus agilis]|uniref:Energy-coupling factor transporter ATP-binding protein n=1 Tax=Ligilactobacillus agilis TaxID=1601 RepID=A0A6F9Y646_9LACO|nr:energy-coupling factor ABC transporter ATP-binding protein [Ligilactobacillus agilis]MDM8279989.1 energy-coupling factor ABC transporter ATP-binding protein [Ligilactobacillus agilis]GET13034.1 energy-coupling factor transporter ATP-binding protein [Ligilactobacillus agilis]
MTTMIKVKDLTYRYNSTDEQPALNKVSLEIEAGQWVAIIGHNGSGKSTLAKALDGLIEPEAGTIEVAGLKLTAKTVWEVRNHIGMVFQNPDNQFVGADVEGDVAFGMENRGLARSEMVRRVKQALAAVNMTAYAKHEPVRLSGGQKQRVAIAGVLALQPDVIIFDESTSMLDPEGRQDIIDLMSKLNQEGFTIISITHDIDEASLAQRVIVLDDGQIIADQKPADLFAKGQALIELGLDVPYPEKLKHELSKLGLRVPTKYLDEEGMVAWLWQLLSQA